MKFIKQNSFLWYEEDEEHGYSFNLYLLCKIKFL